MYVSIDIFAHKYHRVLFYNFAGLESVSKFKYENDGRLDSCLDIDDVTAIVGFKKNKIYELMRHEKFPRPIKSLSRVYWLESDISNFVETLSDDKIAK